MSKYFLSVCAIVRNEAPYIAEWIEFHRLQGIEHFYIYHNCRKDEDMETFNILHPSYTIEGEGLVTYNIWRKWPGQMSAYQHFLDNYGKETEWASVQDVDEFLWSPCTPHYTIAQHLEFNFADKDIAVVAPHWVLYGSNGHKEKTDGLVIERFTKRARDVNPHCKSIIRPALCEAAGRDPHTFKVKEGYLIVGEREEILPQQYAVLNKGTADILQIAHFYCKSYAEYVERKKIGTPDTGIVVKDVDATFEAHNCNDEEDTRLRDLYADKIKEKLNGPRETVEG